MVRLFDFIEEEDPLTILGKNRAKPAGLAGFISNEELHLVEVQEFATYQSDREAPGRR